MEDVLSSRVLVLNKNYTPIAIVTVKEAFVKLCSDLAEVVTVEDGSYCNYDFYSWAEISEFKSEFEELRKDEEFVHTPKLTLVVPRVIRMLTYSNKPKLALRLTRRNIYFRDNNICQYCGKKFPTDKLNLDHVVPKSQGGKNTWENLVCSCIACNSKKAGRTPAEAKMKLIKQPVMPKQNPTLLIHIGNKRYSSWKNFLSETYWTVDISDGDLD